MIYIASPYTHPDRALVEWRVDAVSAYTARLMREGKVAFSPIAHSHLVADHLEDKRFDFEFWMLQDLPILARCDAMHVLCLDGWRASKGVAREILFALTHAIPILYVDP